MNINEIMVIIDCELKHYEHMLKFYHEMEQKEPDNLSWFGAAMACSDHIASLNKIKMRLVVIDKLKGVDFDNDYV